MEHPVRRADAIGKETKMVPNTVNKVLQKLIEIKIVREVTGKKKYRVYSYSQYLNILSEGTEPLP
jgi:transcription initiation factor IIE alpha subunit